MKVVNAHRRTLRLPKSLGNVSTPDGLNDAMTLLLWRMQSKGPQVVLVSPNGHVYPIPHKDYRADLLCVEFPAWWAGTFTSSGDPDDIRNALLHTWREHVWGSP